MPPSMKSILPITLILSSLAVSAQQSPTGTAIYKQIREEFQRAYKTKDYPALIQANRKALEFTHGSSRWMLNLAGCYALAGKKDEAFQTLQRVADMKIDSPELSKDDDFASLKTDPRWPPLLKKFASNNQSVGRDRLVASIGDAQVLTEDIAWSSQTKSFYLSTVRGKKIFRVSNRSDITTFADTSSSPGWPLFAVVADDKRGVLYATAAAMPDFDLSPKADWGRTTLLAFDIRSGKTLRRNDLPDDGVPHVFGDAALAANGDLIISDGLGGAVYRFHEGSFERLDHGEFISPQTPAVLKDGSIIVPDYVRGLALLPTNPSMRITWVKNSYFALNGIDGLYVERYGEGEQPTLYAVQNGISPHRIIRIQLTNWARAVKDVDVLLSNTSGLGEPTHGVFSEDAEIFYFIANSGWDQLTDDGKPKPDVKPSAPEIRELRPGSSDESPTLPRRDIQ